MKDEKNISNRLRALAAEMIHLGVDMAYYGGFAELATHGGELASAGHIVNGWAQGIYIEEQCRP